MPKCPRCKYYFKSHEDEEFKKEVKAARPNAFKPWPVEEEVKLHDMVKAGKSVLDMAMELNRTPGAITFRMTKLGLQFPQTPTPPKEKTQAEWDEEYRQQELKNVGIGT